MFYSGEEWSLNSKTVIIECFKDDQTEIHRTHAHPAFAERFIIPYNYMHFKRAEADEKRVSDIFSG